MLLVGHIVLILLLSSCTPSLGGSQDLPTRRHPPPFLSAVQRAGGGLRREGSPIGVSEQAFGSTSLYCGDMAFIGSVAGNGKCSLNSIHTQCFSYTPHKVGLSMRGGVLGASMASSVVGNGRDRMVAAVRKSIVRGERVLGWITGKTAREQDYCYLPSGAFHLSFFLLYSLSSCPASFFCLVVLCLTIEKAMVERKYT